MQCPAIDKADDPRNDATGQRNDPARTKVQDSCLTMAVRTEPRLRRRDGEGKQTKPGERDSGEFLSKHETKKDREKAIVEPQTLSQT